MTYLEITGRSPLLLGDEDALHGPPRGQVEDYPSWPAADLVCRPDARSVTVAGWGRGLLVELGGWTYVEPERGRMPAY